MTMAQLRSWRLAAFRERNGGSAATELPLAERVRPGVLAAELDMGPDQAQVMARVVDGRARRVMRAARDVPGRRGLRALARLSRCKPTERGGGRVVACAFHTAAVGYVAQQVLAGHPVALLRTPLTQLYFGALEGDQVTLVDALAIAAAAAATRDDRVYFTFPDHFVAGDAGSVVHDLLRRPHTFSLLEVIVALRGRLSVLGAWTERRVEWDRSDPRNAAPILAQVCAALEDVARADPAGLLSWNRLNAARDEVRRERFLRISGSVRACLHAWRAHDPALSDAQFQAASDALAGIIATQGRPASATVRE